MNNLVYEQSFLLFACLTSHYSLSLIMKKQHLVLPLLLISTISSAQYEPMLIKGRKWTSLYTCQSFFDNNTTTCFSESVLIQSDTLINEYSYFAFSNNMLMREDVNAKKVYQMIGGKEYLVYDFDITVGDTLFTNLMIDSLYYDDCLHTDYIVSLDEMIDSHRTITLTPLLVKKNDYCIDSIEFEFLRNAYTIQWVEGIGDKQYAFKRPFWERNITGKLCDEQLICVQDSDRSIYSTAYGDSVGCYVPYKTRVDNVIKSHIITGFVHDDLYVTVPDDMFIKTLDVYNTIGQKILSFDYNSITYNCNIPAGVYMVVVNTSNQTHIIRTLKLE